MPVTNQLNRTIANSVINNFTDILNNFKFIDSLCNVVDSYNKISDLAKADNQSDIQSLLTSNKSIIDNLVARGIIKLELVNTVSPLVNTTKVIFFLQYTSSPNVVSDINLYEVDLSFFYTTNADQDDYSPISNATTYPPSEANNADYIAEVTSVKKSISQLLDLVASLRESF